MVASTAIFVNALNPDEEATGSSTSSTSTTEATGTTVTPTTVVATTSTTLPAQVQAYLDILDGLATRSEELVARAVEVNQQWDDRAISYGATLDDLRALATDTDQFVLDVEDATPDIPSLEPAHLDVTIAARAMAEAAVAMIAGLEDPVSSEGRVAALAEYQNDGTALLDAVQVVRIRAGAADGGGTDGAPD